MATSLLIVVGLAVAAPFLHRVFRGLTHWVLGLATACIAVWLARFFPQLESNPSILESYSWVSSLGLSLSFRADGLGLMLGVLVVGIGSLILIYAGGYLRGHAQLGAFYGYLLLFMASMLGVALADNVLLLFVCWELTSVSSYLLIGFDHERPAARAAALQALLVTGVGGMALLVGLLLMARIGGSHDLSALLSQADLIRNHALYLPILMLVLLGAATKSAQFPFHFWLPNAMEAPSPVSAYLHSATMVKAGVFLLARMTPLLGGTASWQASLMMMGCATMLLGAIMALGSAGLKRILAYSTVSTLGVLTMLLGVGTPEAVLAAVTYLIAHAFYKGALFMLAGSMTKSTGEYDAEAIGGLARAMPITSACAALASLSMAGLPPFFGFVGKESLYEALLGAQPERIALLSAAIVAHMLLLVVALRVGLRPFFSRRRITHRVPREAPPSLWSGPFVLAASGILCGVLCGAFGTSVLLPTVRSIIGDGADALGEISLWHGLTPALGLSGLTLAGGLLVFARRESILRTGAKLGAAAKWGPSAVYAAMLYGLMYVANSQTRVIQSGHLRRYVLVTLLMTVTLVGVQLSWSADPLGTIDFSDVKPQELVVSVIILLAAISAVRSKTRLGAIASLGAVGYGVALLFAFFSAPDLAMTQFLIETLMVILFVLVLYHLPQFATYTGRAARLFDVVVASVFGGLMFWLILAAATIQTHSHVSDYYARHSVPDAHGRNVVNVILVDFRALDTLGEITVIAVAAIGVYALLRLRRARKESEG